MVMKAFRKNVFRTIKQSMGRYLSILGITFLGAVMFSGLLASAPNMIYTANSYFSDSKFFDLKINAYNGFSEEQIDKIVKANGIKDYEKAKTIDSQVSLNSEKFTVRLIGLNHYDNLRVNQLTLSSGRFPDKENEIVIVKPVGGMGDVKIGDTISLENEDESQLVKAKALKIVGIVSSPEYFSNGSISSTVGTGKINYVIYGKESNIVFPKYNELYLTLNYNHKKDISLESNTYINKLKATKEAIKLLIPDESTWIISDRGENVAYVGIKNDIESIAGVAQFFPIIFIIVAAFVALTTMSRLVDEERVIIGTIKSLGYSNRIILSKYLIYASSSSIIGSCLGILVGFNILPNMIWETYSMKYLLPSMIQSSHMVIALVSVLGMTLVTVLSTLWSVRKIVKQNAAKLLTAKAPVAGKRILLEYIKPLWSRLSFLYKVTLRNVLLDKKRMLMTVIGVMGCTTILVTAFGLKDSVQGFTHFQYDQIFKYDATIGYSINKDYSKLDKFLNNSSDVDSKMKFHEGAIEIGEKDKDYVINLTVPEDSDGNIKAFVSLKNPLSGESIPFSKNSVILSENVARRLNVSVGDTIKFNLYGDTVRKSVKVTDITENYQENYLYISPSIYESLYDSTPEYSNYYLKLNKNTSKEKFYDELRTYNAVTYIDIKQKLVEKINDGLQGMNMIVIMLIIAAGLLAFLVLYNINNINVEERTREISTLKVLGFYDKEAESYIFRETMLLTLFGCLLGLLLGYFAFVNVISAIGTDFYMFNSSIKVSVFIFAVIVTFIFAYIINIFMKLKIRSINMLDSLKSVE